MPWYVFHLSSKNRSVQSVWSRWCPDLQNITFRTLYSFISLLLFISVSWTELPSGFVCNISWICRHPPRPSLDCLFCEIVAQIFSSAFVQALFTLLGFLYDATGSYNIPFHVAGIPLLVGAAILFFIPWAQRTAETTNLMSAAHHPPSPELPADTDSIGTATGASIATVVTERAMTPIPEIVLSVDSSFVTVALDDGESYTVPRRIKRRKRESMCSDLSSVSEMATEAGNDTTRQGLSYSRLGNDLSVQDSLSVTGSFSASAPTSPRARPSVPSAVPQVCCLRAVFLSYLPQDCSFPVVLNFALPGKFHIEVRHNFPPEAKMQNLVRMEHQVKYIIDVNVLVRILAD